MRVRNLFLAVTVLTGTPAVDAQERRDEFYHLSEINKASAVMVVEQGIVPSLKADREWVDATRTKSDDVAKKRDALFAQLKSEK